MNVLLIEPDSKLRQVYEKALSSTGHHVTWAAQAQTAIQQADVKRPDVVILELQLSGHNGIEFIYEFRSYEEWQDIPIILQTLVPPHALKITPEMLEECHIVQCLYKPATSLKQLLEAVESAV